ncbi:MAG: protein translocase subunit SecD [Dongiaceae bacterium]
MLQFSKWKITVILAIILAGIIFAAPNLVNRDKLATLPGWIPKTVVSLGLDLQGGSHLLYEVDTKALVAERLSSVVDEVRTQMRAANIGYSDLGVKDGVVTLKLRDPGSADAAKPVLQKAAGSLDLSIGADGLATIKYTDAGEHELKVQAVEQSIEVIRKRIDETGTKEPTIIRQGEDRIVVQLPGVKDPQHLKDIFGQTAKMTFRLVDENAGLSGKLSPTSEMVPWAPDSEEAKAGDKGVPLQKRVMVSGENLTSAQQSFDNGMPVVAFSFDSVGARRFGDATAQNVGKRFAIVLDNKIISAPVIRSAIMGGSGIISGNFTSQSAQDLALLLRAGALPAPLTVLEERSVGADLGADSIAAGKLACILAVVLIVVAMVVLYGLFGIFANVALLLNAILMMAILSLFGATLTFPGIAGMVLTLGMAVDANVLILERVREEMRNGRSPVTAMETGYREAQGTIFDANITHLIATAFLFQFGSGPIKGFAITLIIGIVTSMFTSIWVTRLMTSIWLRRTRPKQLPL